MKVFSILLLRVICVAILFVAFGQITVRKLRKTPETKEHLGVEFASRWDILNVAQALSFPRAANRILERSQFSALYANSEILYQHTTKFDRWLGRIVYWLLVASVVTLLTSAALDAVVQKG